MGSASSGFTSRGRSDPRCAVTPGKERCENSCSCPGRPRVPNGGRRRGRDGTEVADLLGLAHRNSVSVYRHRHDDFPKPTVEKSRCVLWLRADIETWAKTRRP